ncbi:hypothetical protein ACFLYP_01300 [Chloroflexota bacterium]
MVKSGLIAAVAAFLLELGIALVFPLCMPCAAIVIGLIAGFLSGVFDKPIDGGQAAKIGALSGAIGTIGAVVGQIGGQIINAVVVSPEQMAEIYRTIGIPTVIEPSTYYAGVIINIICFGIFNLVLMVGLGAVGGLLWRQFNK